MKLNYKNIALNLLDKWNEEVNVPEGHKPMTQAEDRAFGRSILEGLEKSGEMFRNKIHEKTFIWKGHYDNGCNHVYYFAFLVTFICFMKYCETETKIIKPNGREKHIGTKYVNETRSNIEIVDSTWFTTIVRSEGFSVRGHFRFQPYGVGMQQRKLIWISDFEKSGYTRTAKILNQ